MINSQINTAPPSALGSTSGQSLTLNKLQGLANQQFNQAYHSLLAQQQSALAQQYNQALAARQHRWMVNGETMTFAEFLDAVCPDPDDPQRTYLTLKYAGQQ